MDTAPAATDGPDGRDCAATGTMALAIRATLVISPSDSLASGRPFGDGPEKQRGTGQTASAEGKAWRRFALGAPAGATGADLAGADLAGADLAGAVLAGHVFPFTAHPCRSACRRSADAGTPGPLTATMRGDPGKSCGASCRNTQWL
ncbi:pentapeptide repeat-containing protein [Azospirillum brasilense]|uniref:pentapeptide repeat-containing protein n=1 Tax=Azospirillum brasilense TaxID=192 RepID=UPI003D7CF990